MNGRLAKKIRREAKRAQERLVPEFKKFVNTQLSLWERTVLAWRILWGKF